MLLFGALLSIAAPAPQNLTYASASASEPVVFAFTGGDYDGYQSWDWDTITHLGFWTKPSDDVRALAKKHGVKLFHDCSTPDPKDWLGKDKRVKFTQGCVDDVKTHSFDGVFFDFEGTGLSKDEKAAYVKLAEETTAALAPLKATVAVCVGGRPSYELRNYDYAGLSKATDFLFIMGDDMHLWDDYTCEHTSQGNVCSPAEASIRSLTAGVDEYLKTVDGSKLVLGLPWYGQLYKQIVAPINMGQIDYKDVVKAFDKGKVEKSSRDKDSLSKVINCKGDCLDGKGASKAWYDDAETLTPKFALAGKNKLRGVGIWKADNLPTEDKHADLRKAMWQAVKDWQAVADPPAWTSATEEIDVAFRTDFRVAPSQVEDTCTGPHESCCPAPGGDVHNCPDSARTSDCDKKKSCCCG